MNINLTTNFPLTTHRKRQTNNILDNISDYKNNKNINSKKTLIVGVAGNCYGNCENNWIYEGDIRLSLIEGRTLLSFGIYKIYLLKRLSRKIGFGDQKLLSYFLVLKGISFITFCLKAVGKINILINILPSSSICYALFLFKVSLELRCFRSSMFFPMQSAPNYTLVKIN